MAISEDEMNWIKEQGTTNVGVNEEMVSAWYKDVIDELKKIGMDVALGGEDSPAFTEMIKTGVMGKVQANITVEPTDFNMMFLGPYPEKHINKKASVEMVALAAMDGGNPELASVSAWKEFVPVKNVIEPLASYRTGVSFQESDRAIEPNTFKLTVQGASKFSEETKSVFIADTYDKKLEMLHKMVPQVNLGNIEQSLSRLKRSKNDKTFADSLDLRRVIVVVTGTADGIDKNGRAWAMYHVIDGSFKPTVQVKFIPVWVDPSIFDRLQAGEGSYLEIYGMIQKNNDGSTSMSACFVHPLAVKPLERKENQAQVDQPGGTVQVPDVSQIQVMTSGTELGM